MLTSPASPNRRHVLLVMCAALATVVAGVTSLNVALPDLARDTGASQTQLQWIVDAYALVFAALLLPAGALGDRYGRRGVLLGGLALFGAASLAAVFVEDPTSLIVLRCVLGLAAAAIMPATLSIITHVFPAGERDRAVATWAGVAGGSAVLGLLSSGLLLEAFSWPSIFTLNVLLACVAVAGTLALVPSSRDPDAPPLDPVGALLSAVGLATLVYAIIEGPQRGWTDAVTVAGFATGALGLVLFVLWELRAARPMLDPRLFALRGFGAGSLSITVQFFAFFGFVFLILQYLQLVQGYSPLEAGVAMLPMAAMLIGISPRVPALVDRLGVRVVAPAGLLSMAGGFTILSMLEPGSSYWHLAGGLVLLGVGGALATTPATTAIVSSLPDAKQGVASAVNDTARELGGALGIAVLGSVLNDAYRSGVTEATAGAPERVADGARDSLGFALAAAERLGPRGTELAARAQDAFVDGLGTALLVGAGAVALAAVVVAWLAPRRGARTAPASGPAGPEATNLAAPSRAAGESAPA